MFEHKAARVLTVETVDKAHGRIERRCLEVALGLEGHRPVRQFLDWPYLEQAFRITRTTQRDGKTSTVVSYAISSLPLDRLSPAQALRLWRGHWSIENRLHWVRDVTFDEDRSQVRTGAAPQVMACLRNLTINLLRLKGHNNIAAALRTYAAKPNTALEIIGVKLH